MADPAPPPPPSAPRPPRGTTLTAKAAAKSRSTLFPVVLGAACVAILVGGWFLLRSRTPKHDLDVFWPVAREGGEAVPLGHAVRAGDAFDMKLKVRTGVVLGEAVDPMSGMTLDAELRFEHTLAATDDGALRSTIAARLDSCYGTLPFLPPLISAAMRAEPPLQFFVDRDADGSPRKGTARIDPAVEGRRVALEYLFSGLSDLSTTYLPPRAVRVGEVWDLNECAQLGGIVEAVRTLATLQANPAGFPAGTWRGQVGAEGLEDHEGARCVRLRIALETKLEGPVVAPAEPGALSAVAKVEGTAWVALDTGVLWGLDTRSEVRSTYKVARKSDERWARQFVTGTTKRRG